MQAGDRHEIREQLALYKERGVVQFDRVLQIPSQERIQALITLPGGRVAVSAVLSASVNSALQSMNTRLSMTAEQILDLADEIIDQSAEDNLGLEDVLLFLQMMITGQTGKNYDRMDIPTFFEMFEVYRQDRHEKVQAIRDEQSVNHKAAGDPTRLSESREDIEDGIRKVMVDYRKQELERQHLKGEK